MKGKILIALIFLCTNCPAQITITKSDMPAAGDTLRFSTALPSQTVNLAQTGANYAWDFSQLKPIAQHIDTFFAISALPKSYKTIFAGASFATHTVTPDSIGPIKLSNVYTMYLLNSSAYGGLGVGEEIDGFPTPLKYDSIDVLYSFPLNFGSIDSSHTGYALSIPTLAYTSEKRKRVNECDGWGMLTTPFGTFNVLRVKSTLTLSDSIYVDALSFGLTVPTIDYQYKWLAAGGGEPILEIDAQDILGTPVIESITYRDSAHIAPAGINIVSTTGIKIYPNPVSDKLYFTGLVNNPAQAQLKIYSIYGNLVYEQTNFYASSIVVSMLPIGTYIAELQQGNVTTHEKFVVIR